MSITRVVSGNTVDAETGELVPLADPVMGMEVAQARAAMQRAQDLTAALLEPDDWQVVGDRRFVKRAGNLKIAYAYGLTLEVRSQERERDDDGQIQHAHVVVRAIRPDGRYADGDGACSITEDRFVSRKGRAKAEHDVMATATTRAMNRAINNVVGFGQVSAEEADEITPPAKLELPHWAKPAGPDQVVALADQLVLILTALGDPTPADTVRVMGGVVRAHTDSGIPNIVGLLTALIADEAARSLTRADTDSAGEAPSGPPTGDPGADPYNDASEASVPADGPETASGEEESAA